MATDISQGAMEAMASHIITCLREPFRIGAIEIYTSCSLGIALAPQHGEDYDSVIAVPILRSTALKRAGAVSSVSSRRR